MRRLPDAAYLLIHHAGESLGVSAVAQDLSDNVGCAQLCLQQAYTALTEAEMSEVDSLILESGPSGPSIDLIAQDDPRFIKLLALHERLSELVASHPPSARSEIADILGELRDLCASLGFQHPEPKRP
jgi:hypothetical protein